MLVFAVFFSVELFSGKCRLQYCTVYTLGLHYTTHGYNRLILVVCNIDYFFVRMHLKRIIKSIRTSGQGIYNAKYFYLLIYQLQQ